MLGGAFCNCCNPCGIFDDDFSTDQLATAYDTRSGSWSVTGGEAQTASSNALIVANTAYTTETAAYVTAEVQGASTSDNARLVFLYQDDNTYWFAQVRPGASNGVLQLFERSGGVNTQRGANGSIIGFTTSTTATVVLCYAGGVVTAEARATSTLVRITFSSTETVAGTKAGIGTGSITSRADFLSFAIKKHGVDVTDCPKCGAACGTGCATTPASVAVTLGGFGNGTCSGCASYNTTFILSRNLALPCYYTFPFSGSCIDNGGFDLIEVTLSSFAGQATIAVRAIINSASVPLDATSIIWEDLTIGTAPADCATLGTISVPFKSSSAADRCTHDSSDATVTFS